jgi:hypothetical protein
LQTTLVHGLSRLFGGAEITRALAAESLEAPGEGASLPYAPAPVRQAPAYRPAARWRWGGIILTSILFALLHEAWSIPLIFLLSLVLGYLYERTGSLWTSILVHFGFNTVNLMLVLPGILYG